MTTGCTRGYFEGKYLGVKGIFPREYHRHLNGMMLGYDETPTRRCALLFIEGINIFLLKSILLEQTFI